MRLKAKKIVAILGPTNTGKTFSAIQTIFKYNNGVIGFPLRLLARENYEFAKKQVGDEKVALITGEEKIIPKMAKYFFCTVESIPDQRFEFVAIDEIQLASDYERGHLFTEKIMNKIGAKETMFLGSLSMEEILKKIYPEIKIYKKPRLSKLTYSGYKNLARLPKRSAVIAFSQIDVYEIANKIKQIHGGVSVVMGALSPDVRNAQVKIFEDGKVDHIVATDAIGLGLNLNIKYIFFSSLVKFDGIRKRVLTNDEISQIAGRAGRHINDGFFGTTGSLKTIQNEVVNYIESYDYTKIKKIFWRNSLLNFQSINNLIKSLGKKTDKEFLVLKKNASDQRFLKILISNSSVKKKISIPHNIKILWDLCGTPDYSRDLDEFHSRFLKKIFLFLSGSHRMIPENWILNELKNIKTKTKKIAELNYKISQIRKWSFLAFKSNWMENNINIKKQVKEIEYKLSLLLHSQLINQFIGVLKNLKIKSSNNLKSSVIKLNKDNSINFGSEIIGKLDGFVFNISSIFRGNKNIFDKKLLKLQLSNFAKKHSDKFISSEFSELEFDINGIIYWKKKPVARLIKSLDILKPKINLIVDDFFGLHQARLQKKTQLYFDYLIKNKFRYVEDVNSFKSPSQNFRAINYSLFENLGHCKKQYLKSYYNSLKTDEINFLKKRGFKIGTYFFFYKSNDSNYLRQTLINISNKNLLKKFFDNKFIFSEKLLINSEIIKIYSKMGFYLIKLKNKKYFVNFEYLELTIRKIMYLKKNKVKNFIPSNNLEHEIFNGNIRINFTN